MVIAAREDIGPESGCRVVEGQGHIDPLVLVIGEAPGDDEVRSGFPSVGKAGTMFRGELSLAGIDPHAVYITYAVKCQPTKKRTANDVEIAAWSDVLASEVQTRDPVHIILAGKVAQKAWALIRGKVGGDRYIVHVLPNPGAIMRDRRLLPAFQDAFRRIGRIVNGLEVGEVVQEVAEPWEEGEPDLTAPYIGVDTEFRLLNDGGSDDALVCIQVSDGTSAALYRWDSIQRVRDDLRRTHVYAHNIKADAQNLGVDLDNLESWDDTGLMAYVLRYPRVGLKTIGPELTGIPMLPISDILTGYTTTSKTVRLTKRGLPAGSANVTIEDNGDGTYTRTVRKKKKRDFGEALEEDYEAAKDYALRDAVVTSRIAEILEPKLRAEPVLWKYYQEIEKPIVPVLDRMERRGVAIDELALEPMREQLDDAIAFHERALRQLLGKGDDFKPSSNEQLAQALIGIGLDLTKETKGGAISVDKDGLLRAIGEIDLEKIDESTDDAKRLAVVHILRSREYAKLRTTYVERLLTGRDASGRIHASFNQMVADTNRFSSSGPNLQNIPVRGQVGTAIRRAFVASPGYTLVKTDFSALEVRIFAHLTQDEAIIRAFEAGISPHDLNAERFKVKRDKIKNWYFAVIYGAEPLKAAVTAGVSIEDAWAMIDLVKKESPAIVQWPIHVQNFLIEHGYAQTIFGWRNYYPHFWSPVKAESAAALREAANLPVQGSASTIVKLFMIAQDALAREMGGGLVLQVHDETVAEVPVHRALDFARGTAAIVRGLGDMGVGFSVPLDVEIKEGESWGAMKTLYKEGTWKI